MTLLTLSCGIPTLSYDFADFVLHVWISLAFGKHGPRLLSYGLQVEH